MNTLSVSQFKANCLRLFQQIVRTQKPLVVTKRGAPLVDVIPHQKRSPPAGIFGCLKGTVTYMGDIVSPAVPEDEWEARA